MIIKNNIMSVTSAQSVTSRAGKKWLSDEEDELKNMLINEEQSIEDIAEELKRSVKAVTSRIYKIALEDMTENTEKSIDTICHTYNINKVFFNEFIDKDKLKVKKINVSEELKVMQDEILKNKSDIVIIKNDVIEMKLAIDNINSIIEKLLIKKNKKSTN
jgi:hypothetical protein